MYHAACVFQFIHYHVLYLSTESLNADMVKADAPDAVVAQEPQGIDPVYVEFIRQMYSFNIFGWYLKAKFKDVQICIVTVLVV